MLLEHSCFEVKLTLHCFLGLAQLQKGLNWPGWAVLGSPHTLTLAGTHPLHPLLITIFKPTLIADTRD